MRHLHGRKSLWIAAVALSQIGPATPVVTQMTGVAAPMAASQQVSHSPRRLFLSGHSLMDHPFPEYLERLAASIDQPFLWDMQQLAGSSIKDRTMGQGSGRWTGYAAGTNRNDQPIDVLAELQRAGSNGSHPYDMLIITEQHSLLDAVVRNDMIRYLRDFHDRMIEQNPQARTYVFEAWMTVADMDNPASWIAYERSAAPTWRCVADRINHDLAASGRPDRLMTIPAGSALAALAEQALSPLSVPGLKGQNARATMATLFRDDVHLTETGTYFVALLTSAIMHGRAINTLERPFGMREDTAQRLQQIAWNFTTDLGGSYRPMSSDACLAYLSDDFAPAYLAYQRDLQWRRNPGADIWLRWVRLRLSWPSLFRRRDASNPFHIDEPVVPIL
jgi:hypothetical protein